MQTPEYPAAAGQPANLTPFAFALGQRAAVQCSGECGDVIARSEHASAEPQYLLRYRAADGRATEAWWQQSALEAAGPAPRAGTAQPLGAVRPNTVPAIGTFWPEQGGFYAGVARGLSGAADHHLVLSMAKPSGRLMWTDAVAWAEGLQADGHGDWVLPTLAQSSLLYANLKDQFEWSWHWTGEFDDDITAWGQDFEDCFQGPRDQFDESRARAVRRLPLQSFVTSEGGVPCTA